jgi:hypothetical protein
MRLISILMAALAIVTVVTSCEKPSQSTGPLLLGHGGDVVRGPARGPLRPMQSNPRYFTDGSGKAVYLTGSHTWDNRQDIGTSRFDWTEYLDRLQQYDHNFIRLWVWEQPKGLTTGPDPAESMPTIAPELFGRTGPGIAADGRPRFDLTKLNDAHIARLRQRVVEARDRGFYVSIMLFNGWSIEQKAGGGDPWTYHPFNRANNVNGIDGDPNHDGRGSETHTLQIPAVTRVQESYVRQVVDVVNDLDNVLYEVSNESDPQSHPWQYHMIQYVKDYEATRSKQHPVGMTVTWPNGSNDVLDESPADWISPNHEGGYVDAPPVSSGGRVVLSDTDHLWGIGGTRSWAWKSFTRGLNVLYMDPWESRVIPAGWNADLRVNMGYIRHYAGRPNLAAMRPRPDLASTGYCLAEPGLTYLIYLPGAEDGINMRFVARFFKLTSPWIPRRVTVDLKEGDGILNVEWFRPRTGEIVRADSVRGGRTERFAAPFGGDAVLYLYPGGAGSSQH